MRTKKGRTAVALTILAVILVSALIVVAALAYFFLSGSSPSPSMSTTLLSTSVASSPTTSSSASQTSSILPVAATSSSSSGGLTITDMFGDVDAPGDQAPTSNSSSVADQSTFNGAAGQTFLVMFQVSYMTCVACPSQLTSVRVSTPGFVVLGTTPTLPVGLIGAGPQSMVASFTVELKAPSTPYTGTLTLIAETG